MSKITTKVQMMNVIVNDIDDWKLDDIIEFAKFKRKEELRDLTLAEVKEQYWELVN